MEIRVTIVSAPSEECAREITLKLIEARQSACVNIISGVRSIYRWQGKIEDEKEVLLLIKSPAAGLEKLHELIKKIHPYENPEIVSIAPERVAKAYAEWINNDAKG